MQGNVEIRKTGYFQGSVHAGMAGEKFIQFRSDRQSTRGYDSLALWRVSICRWIDPTCGESCRCLGGRKLGVRHGD